ncbi:MAG: proline dehydrogenase family protein [Acidobacteriota bacterium]
MFDYVSRAFFHTLAGRQSLKHLASRYGLRRPDSFARRFIAGETVDEAIAAGRAIQAAGLTLTLDLLGESVNSMAEADAATRTYLGVIERIAAAGVERNLSLKLTQLGLTVDRATCVDNLRRILDLAGTHGFFVRVDMESSAFTQVTLEIFETMWQQGYRNVGVVLQSYLRRSMADAERMNALGARVRLVKGAYNEPKSVAFQSKADVDAAFVEIMQALLSRGTYPAIATHDPAMLAAARSFAAARGIAPDRYEYQMLYGVRRDLQGRLKTDGYRVRVYVPFGREWFPYFMRRLGERPANVGFVIRSLLQERSGSMTGST